MRRLLITGGAGFIGANFVHYWMNKYPQHRVVVFDALTYAGNLDNLQSLLTLSTFRFVTGNLKNYDLLEHLLQAENIDTIVHFAAESHVDRSISGPDIFIETNVVGTHQLLKAARKVWRGKEKDFRFHHVSTDEVYGSLNSSDPAFSESITYAPNSPYAASKAASDHLVRAYFHTYGLPITISNCSNNFGPYQFPEKLIPLLITNALQGKNLPIYGDGKNIRDWLYVEDHCRGIELVLDKGKIGEVYNIGGNNEQNNIHLANTLCQILDELFATLPDLAKQFPNCPAAKDESTASLIEFVTDRPGHDRRYAINAEKISRELGYSPKENFISVLKKTVQWYLENETWWRNIIKKQGSHLGETNAASFNCN
jgi:dTDP-glucose 4,6-dehydratase